jgi:AraC-like DNA-binding protein
MHGYNWPRGVKRRRSVGNPGTHAPEFFSAQVAEARRFYRDLKPPGRMRLAVVCGGLEHCTPEYAVSRKTFPFFSIEYVVRGHGFVKLNGVQHTLRPGRFFSYGPSVAHEIWSAPADPLVKYFVDFAGTHGRELLQSCRLSPPSIAQAFPPHTLCTLFDELIESGLQSGTRNASLCAALLEAIALKIPGIKAPMESAESIAFATYHQCRQFIEQHFLRLRTLKEISKECHLNNAYLCRLFRRYDDQSPYQYLLRLKINHAADRLQRPGALVKQVGELVGLVDPFHFSRVFKSVLGVSPSTFRTLR